MKQTNLPLSELDDQARLRIELQVGSMPTVRLDPNQVSPSQWANRNAAAFTSASFLRLKESIASDGGNTQPILVRSAAAGGYEIVFGHRRHRACQESGVPVLAVISECMSDLDLFIAMDRENREREDLSAFEQGSTYAHALSAGLFPSQRRLAETLGVSHTWVRKAMSVAQLPSQVLAAFKSPLQIQATHAAAILTAMERDPDVVLQRATSLACQSTPMSPALVVSALTDSPASNTEKQFAYGGRKLGTWTVNRRGYLVLTIESTVLGPASIEQVAVALGNLTNLGR